MDDHTPGDLFIQLCDVSVQPLQLTVRIGPEFRLQLWRDIRVQEQLFQMWIPAQFSDTLQYGPQL